MKGQFPKRSRGPLLFIAVVSLFLAGAGFAQQNFKLPPDYVFPQTVGSPGKVTFRHGSHVDPKQPQCTSCHPKLFRILEAGTPAEGGPITHGRMAAGRECGACHNGKVAFGLQDNCTACHRTQ